MILFGVSLQSFHLENPLSEHLLHNFQLIVFLIITLVFISSNILVIVFYNKMRARFSSLSSEEVPINTQANHNKLTLFLNYLQEAVLIVDSNLCIKESNRLAERLFRFKFEKQHLFDIKTAQNALIIDRCQLLIDKVIKNGCVFKDGLKIGKAHAIYLDLIALPILGEDKVALIIQDKSSDYKILDMGKDFIANASHELRTPITIIEGFAETLRDLPTVSESMLQDITEKIIRSCHRMNGLVKHLLVLADLDNTSNIILAPCDLVSLIEGCSHLLLSVHPNACIEVLQNENEIYIEANVDLLERAIMNLFENAVKYSVSMPHITVTIKADGAKVLLQIEDRGPGIAEEALPQIFNRFYRVNKDRSRERGGTGLGLSIVQSILEKHRADIRVFSEVGVGTRFELVFDSLTPASLHS